MATQITKPVSRQTSVVTGHSRRPLIVTILPNGLINIREKGLRKGEDVSIEAVYHLAIRQRVASEKREKKAAKKAKG